MKFFRNLKLKRNKNTGPAPYGTASSRTGFAVLFTVLISSIVLAIAIGVSTVAYQEVVLSSSAREGSISFFAADTGAECALYWDRLDIDAFGKSGPASISCAGNNLTVNVGGSPLTASFNLDLDNFKSCAKVTIVKNPPPGFTEITSLGYNMSCAETNLIPTPPKIVERAIRVTY